MVNVDIFQMIIETDHIYLLPIVAIVAYSLYNTIFNNYFVVLLAGIGDIP